MKIFCSILVVFLIFVTTSAAKESQKAFARITKDPKKASTVLLGNNIKLEWTFQLQSVDELKRILLFRYSISSRAKNTIAWENYGTDNVKYNRQAKDKYQCDVNVQKDGIGSASIMINNIQFNYSGDYGVSLEPRRAYSPKLEDSVSVRVVDMILADEKTKLRTVKSWVGKKTPLTCQVIYRGKTAPTFQWFKASRNELTEGITSSYNTSVLKLHPSNKTDFGEYTCKAETKTVTVTQKFLVVKLEYPGPPTDVVSKFYKERKVHTVFWEHPEKQYQHEAKEYVIEIWKPEKKQWKFARKTLILSISFPKLKSSTKVRVCSMNEIGYNESSCCKPVMLDVPDSEKGNTHKRSRSYQMSPCLLLVLVGIFISKTLNDS